MRRFFFIFIFPFILFSSGFIFGANSDQLEDKNKTKVDLPVKNQEKKKKDSSDTIQVEVKPIKIFLTLNGFLEDSEARTLSVSTDNWSELRVLNPPVQGKIVNKGEVIMNLDLEKIRQEIQNLEHQLSLMKFDHRMLQIELSLAKDLAPIDMMVIERNEKYAKEDLEKFNKQDLPFQRKSLQMILKRYRDYLKYSQEELNQLKKMYEEDDLTEETEEIILQRAKDEVEFYKFNVEYAEKRFEDFNSILAPRSKQSMQESFERENLNLAALKKTSPAQIELLEIRLSKLEKEKSNIASRIAKLQKDLKNMTLKSPVKGRLFWGTFNRGKWAGPTTLKNKLQKGGSLKAHEPILTICPGKILEAHVDIPEKHLASTRKNLTGKLTFASDPEIKLEAKVIEVSNHPHMPNVYSASISFTLPKGTNPPSPGTACSFKFVSYEKKSASTLPAKTIFSEDHDPEVKFVYILNKSGKGRKKIVEIGKKIGDSFEVLSGINQTHKVLVEKP